MYYRIRTLTVPRKGGLLKTAWTERPNQEAADFAASSFLRNSSRVVECEVFEVDSEGVHTKVTTFKKSTWRSE